MRRRKSCTFALGAAAAMAAACMAGKAGGIKREAVLALLQQEALSLKRDGEKVNPDLGVKTTWNVLSVDVRDQAGNESQPWAGTIRFRIESTMKEVDGSLSTQQFEKRFEYVYSTVTNGWINQYVPPPPARPKG
jgi:hypothetical protein